MNVFKKISLKYFNGSSNLNEGEERDIITSRDKAFIYACRKYNIDFEYYNFFSGAHFVEESDFEPEHSLIKCNFSELKKYNHFKWFAYLLSSQLDKERIPQFKAVLKLLERKREPYFYAVIEAIEKGLKENRQNISVYVNVKGNLWDSGMKYAISKPIHITILWTIADKTLDHIFYEIPAKVEENIRKAQEAARKAQREWEERIERERRERERLNKKMHIRELDSMVIKDLSLMMILQGLITNTRVGGIISQENKLNANKRQLILTLLFTQCCKSLQQLIRK